MLPHRLLHDLSAPALTRHPKESALTQGCPVSGVPSELPSAKLGWGLPEVLNAVTLKPRVLVRHVGALDLHKH